MQKSKKPHATASHPWALSQEKLGFILPIWSITSGVLPTSLKSVQQPGLQRALLSVGAALETWRGEEKAICRSVLLGSLQDSVRQLGCGGVLPTLGLGL